MSAIKEDSWIRRMLKNRDRYSGRTELVPSKYETCEEVVNEFGESLVIYGKNFYKINYYFDDKNNSCYIKYTAHKK